MGMGRRPKADALTNAEHQQRYRARHDLVAVTIPREVWAAIQSARTTQRPKVSDVLRSALAALSREDAAIARLPQGPATLTPQRRRNARRAEPSPPGLFDLG
jgi:hypothetical protein